MGLTKRTIATPEKTEVIYMFRRVKAAQDYERTSNRKDVVWSENKQWVVWSPTDRIGWGKHAGMTWLWAFERDYQYCHWACKNLDLPVHIKKFVLRNYFVN